MAHPPLIRLLIKATAAALTVYTLLALGHVVYLRVKYATLSLDAVEPAPDMSDARPGPLPPGPGRYGPDPPHALARREGHRLTLTINGLGARNRFEVTGQEDDLVVLLGDSFFFGYALSDDETVSHFLGRLDPRHRYVNLAMAGFNLIETVDRFAARQARLRRARLVVLQTLLHNDLAAERHLDQTMRAMTEADHDDLLPPLGLMVTLPHLEGWFWHRVWPAIRADQSPRRFRTYFEAPLRRLRALLAPTNTPLAVVLYHGPDRDDRARYQPLTRQLKSHCKRRNIPLYDIYDLLPDNLSRARLDDGHPNAAHNRALARALLPRLGAVLSGREKR